MSKGFTTPLTKQCHVIGLTCNNTLARPQCNIIATPFIATAAQHVEAHSRRAKAKIYCHLFLDLFCLFFYLFSLSLGVNRPLYLSEVTLADLVHDGCFVL